MQLDLILMEKLIVCYYEMLDGELIDNFNSEIFFSNDILKINLKYKVLKHIVEQRKRDGYTDVVLLKMFQSVIEILNNKKYRIVNNKKEENSFLFVEIIEDKNMGVVLVLEIVSEKENTYYIKTGFYRASNKIKKLLK